MYRKCRSQINLYFSSLKTVNASYAYIDRLKPGLHDQSFCDHSRNFAYA